MPNKAGRNNEYYVGWDAFSAGAQAKENPYKARTVAAAQWQIGWLDAKQDADQHHDDELLAQILGE